MTRKLLFSALPLAVIATMILAAGFEPQPAVAHDAHDMHETHAQKTFAAGETGKAGVASRTVEIALSDDNSVMALSPDRLEVKQGDQIRFVLKNVGSVDHEFLIDTVDNNAHHKMAMQENPEMRHDEPNGARIAPGATKELVWRFTKPGSFEFACLIPGHYEAGMKGIVVVR
jgi:uncharacterized cupredoxin-like copper-binding protein